MGDFKDIQLFGGIYTDFVECFAVCDFRDFKIFVRISKLLNDIFGVIHLRAFVRPFFTQLLVPCNLSLLSPVKYFQMIFLNLSSKPKTPACTSCTTQQPTGLKEAFSSSVTSRGQRLWIAVLILVLFF